MIRAADALSLGCPSTPAVPVALRERLKNRDRPMPAVDADHETQPQAWTES
jgi:hypothetical protein